MLHAVTLPTSAITAPQVVEMFRLMERHYDGVEIDRFTADLEEKDRVVLLSGPEGAIWGFTTLMSFRLEHPATRATVRILFSGDTIIDRRHWGSQALAFEWIYQAGKEKAQHPGETLLWFLISKGPRTYRYLSAFCRRLLAASFGPHTGLHRRPHAGTSPGSLRRLLLPRHRCGSLSHQPRPLATRSRAGRRC